MFIAIQEDYTATKIGSSIKAVTDYIKKHGYVLEDEEEPTQAKIKAHLSENYLCLYRRGEDSDWVEKIVKV